MWTIRVLQWERVRLFLGLRGRRLQLQTGLNGPDPASAGPHSDFHHPTSQRMINRHCLYHISILSIHYSPIVGVTHLR